MAELTELDRLSRGFDRIPDEWCAGWWEMCDRARDTLRLLPCEQRAAARAVFFDQPERLLNTEYAAEAAQEKAQPAKAGR